VCLALAGCGGAAPPPKAPEKCPEQNVTVSLLASPSVNPAAGGGARAVVVRVYQLKSDARLVNATFDQVWKEDKVRLGDDLVKEDEVLVYPATRADLSFMRAELVQHVAAVALFQSPQGRSWVASMDLPPLPEAGKCGVAACDPEDDECSARSVAAPRLAFWLDASKVDDGVEHTDDFPKPGPMKGRRRP
jgi:type VI secretion system protein VasD